MWLCVCKSSIQDSESLFIHAMTHICSPERPHQKPHCPHPLTPFASFSVSLYPASFFFASTPLLNHSLRLPWGLFIGWSWQSQTVPPPHSRFHDFLNHMVKWNPHSNTCTVTHSSNRKVRSWRLQSVSIETLLHLNQLAQSWELRLKALDQKQFGMFWGFYFQTKYGVWLTCFALTLPFKTMTPWDQYCNQYPTETVIHSYTFGT